MRDVVTTPGYVHIDPRERLIRHARNKIRERFDPDIDCRAVRELSARFSAGEFIDGLLEGEGLDGREIYMVRLWGQMVKVVYDRRYDAVVTALRDERLRRFVGGGLHKPRRRHRR